MSDVIACPSNGNNPTAQMALNGRISDLIVCPSNGNNPTAQTAQVNSIIPDGIVCPSNGNNPTAHRGTIILSAAQNGRMRHSFW